MKPVRIFWALPLIFVLIASTSSTFVSCKKTTTIHDTTTVTVHDTTIVTDSIYDLSDGLVAYYNFNNGNLNDSSGFNNKIVFNNATPAADRFGNANNAYSFDGSSSYMQVTNSQSLNSSSITLFAIVKVNGFYMGSCHGNQVLGKGYPDLTNGFYCIRFTDTSTQNDCSAPANTSDEIFEGSYGDVGSGNGTYAYGNNSIIQIGQWYNIIFTFDGFSAKFYVNGQLQGTRSNINVSFTPNTNDFFIGKYEDPTFPYYFNGVIDEIRIYNRALAGGEISSLNNLKE
ncbi:MAG TPA: LamG domain-containing protein [Puia sp.]|jgi:hypothetical protein|nr:LamG domain-containing protein [Puia sp.]